MAYWPPPPAGDAFVKDLLPEPLPVQPPLMPPQTPPGRVDAYPAGSAASGAAAQTAASLQQAYQVYTTLAPWAKKEFENLESRVLKVERSKHLNKDIGEMLRESQEWSRHLELALATVSASQAPAQPGLPFRVPSEPAEPPLPPPMMRARTPVPMGPPPPPPPVAAAPVEISGRLSSPGPAPTAAPTVPPGFSSTALRPAPAGLELLDLEHTIPPPPGLETPTAKLEHPPTPQPHTPQCRSSRPQTPQCHSSRPQTPQCHSSRPQTPQCPSSRPQTPQCHSSRPQTPQCHASRPQTPQCHSSQPQTPQCHSSRPQTPQCSSQLQTPQASALPQERISKLTKEDGAIRVEWRIDNVKKQFKDCVGRPVVSPPFEVLDLQELRLMVFPHPGQDHSGLTMREQKSKYEARVQEEGLSGEVTFKVFSSPGTKELRLTFNLFVGDDVQGPFEHDFAEQIMNTCNFTRTNWLDHMKGSSLVVGVELLNVHRVLADIAEATE